jgi:hypothetical protein
MERDRKNSSCTVQRTNNTQYRRPTEPSFERVRPGDPRQSIIDLLPESYQRNLNKKCLVEWGSNKWVPCLVVHPLSLPAHHPSYKRWESSIEAFHHHETNRTVPSGKKNLKFLIFLYHKSDFRLVDSERLKQDRGSDQDDVRALTLARPYSSVPSPPRQRNELTLHGGQHQHTTTHRKEPGMASWTPPPTTEAARPFKKAKHDLWEAPPHVRDPEYRIQNELFAKRRTVPAAPAMAMAMAIAKGSIRVSTKETTWPSPTILPTTVPVTHSSRSIPRKELPVERLVTKPPAVSPCMGVTITPNPVSPGSRSIPRKELPVERLVTKPPAVSPCVGVTITPNPVSPGSRSIPRKEPRRLEHGNVASDSRSATRVKGVHWGTTTFIESPKYGIRNDRTSRKTQPIYSGAPSHIENPDCEVSDEVLAATCWV